MIVFTELWKAKTTWHELSQDERGNYLSKMQPTIPVFLEKGAEIIAWGHNSAAVTNAAPYDYFAIWSFPNEEVAGELQQLLIDAQWYHYFEQVNIMGKGTSPDEVIGHMINL